MKALILVLLIIPTMSFGQTKELQLSLPDIPVSNNKVTFTLVDTLDAPKAKLHSQLNEWIALNFKNPIEVIKLNDQVAGKIIVKGAIPTEINVNYSGGNKVIRYYQKFSIDLTIKDNKYRIVITDVGIQTGTTNIQIEDHLAFISKPYVFENLKKSDKDSINASKSYLINSISVIEKVMKSMTDFITNKNLPGLKSDDF